MTARHHVRDASLPAGVGIVVNVQSDVSVTIAAVRELRRAWVSVDGVVPGLVVGIDVDPDNDAARGVVTGARRAALPSGDHVELILTNDRGLMCRLMWANTQPFHVKD